MEKETKIQNDIRVELSKVGIVRRNNVGTFFTAYGVPIKIGMTGEADLTLFAYKGKTVFIEIKTLTGKQRERQKAFQKAVENLGFEYVILRSVDDAKKLIQRLESG